MKKILFRKKIVFKSKSNKRRKNKKYIKDESLKHFLLQHSKVRNLDFSKIKIPSFLDVLSQDDSSLEEINLPRFKLNSFSDIKNETEKGNKTIFKSFIF